MTPGHPDFELFLRVYYEAAAAAAHAVAAARARKRGREAELLRRYASDHRPG